MGTINKPNTFSPNTTASSSEVNDNFDTIYNEFNGSIAAANLASNSVTTAKIADSNVTTAKIADSNVTTAKIADANVTTAKIATDAVTDDLLDYPRWWQEIGRTTLSSAGDTISVTGLPARTYLYIKVAVKATGGTVSVNIRFNNDSTSTYSVRSSTNGAADATAVSQSNIELTGAAAYPLLAFDGYITNISTVEKNMLGMRSGNFSGAGAGTAPDRAETASKWANTSAQITRVDILNLSGTGDFAIGSEVIIMGHN